MADSLRRKGMSLDAILDICLFCGKEMESVDHLFLLCNFAHFLWCLFLALSGVQWCCLGSFWG